MKTALKKQPNRIETGISVIILAVLAIVTGWVFLHQFQVNPAVLALRPDTHSYAPQEVPLIDTTGSDIVPFSAPEHFEPDTLYEKINGRADLYLSSGFVSLNAQRYTLPRADGNWIEVFIYDMQTPENAFSVYSMQRRKAATIDPGLPDAYRTENALYMNQGQFYLELIGTNADDNLKQAMGTLAGLFMKSHGSPSKPQTPGANLFPAEGLDTGTRKLIAANAFGYEALDHIHTAEFLLDGTRLTAFASDRQKPEAASALVGNYTQTLMSYGATIVDAQPLVAGATVLHFFDTYEIVFSQGRYLAGIHEAADLKKADGLAKRLADHLAFLADH